MFFPFLSKLAITAFLSIVFFSNNSHALEFVFEVDAGINLFLEDEETLKKKLNLERIGSKTAISYDIKAGVQFAGNWAILLAYGYSKRPDYYYALGAVSPNSTLQESQKNYSLGIDTTYFFWDYLNKFNIAISLGNRVVLKSIRVTKLEYSQEQITQFYAPSSVLSYQYLFAPELKFYYRFVDNAMVYFAVQYNIVAPKLEHYPVFLLGVDIHFSLIPIGNIKTEAERSKFAPFSTQETSTQ